MNEDEKTCPRCAETIKRAAVVCRFCGHEFGEVPPPEAVQPHSDSPAPSQWLPPRSNAPDDPSATGGDDWRGQLRKVAGFGCLGFLGLAFLGAIIGGSNEGSNTAVLESTNEALPINAFDNLAASATDDAAPVSDWRTSTQQDELRGKPVHHASVVSENSVEFEFPYHGGSNLTMTVRRHPRWGDDVIFRISKGQFVCGIDNCRGTINYGTGAVSIGLVEPEDHSSDTLFAQNASGLIGRLKKADRVIVELPFYREGNRQFTFNTKELVWPPKG